MSGTCVYFFKRTDMDEAKAALYARINNDYEAAKARRAEPFDMYDEHEPTHSEIFRMEGAAYETAHDRWNQRRLRAFDAKEETTPSKD